MNTKATDSPRSPDLIQQPTRTPLQIPSAPSGDPGCAIHALRARVHSLPPRARACRWSCRRTRSHRRSRPRPSRLRPPLATVCVRSPLGLASSRSYSRRGIRASSKSRHRGQGTQCLKAKKNHGSYCWNAELHQSRGIEVRRPNVLKAKIIGEKCIIEGLKDQEWLH